MRNTAKDQEMRNPYETPSALQLTSDERACVYILSDIFLLTIVNCKEGDRIANELARVPFDIDEIEILFWDEAVRVGSRTSTPRLPCMKRL
jgi:hypothetical protein